MGSDNPPNNDLSLQNNSYSAQGLGVPRQQMNQYRQRLNSDPYNLPNDSEKLQPIRRHSNISEANSINNQLKNVLSHNSSKTLDTNNISQSNSHELPSLMEKNRSRKMSQQYCADFKKSYLSEGTGTKNRFLNHLADRLNYGTQIPKEEIEKFKQEYLPKYVFDWRNVEDPRTGIKYWKNFGKIYCTSKSYISEKNCSINATLCKPLLNPLFREIKKGEFTIYVMTNDTEEALELYILIQSSYKIGFLFKSRIENAFKVRINGMQDWFVRMYTTESSE